jgi:hypothetical protein
VCVGWGGEGGGGVKAIEGMCASRGRPSTGIYEQGTGRCKEYLCVLVGVEPGGQAWGFLSVCVTIY